MNSSTSDNSIGGYMYHIMRTIQRRMKSPPPTSAYQLIDQTSPLLEHLLLQDPPILHGTFNLWRVISSSSATPEIRECQRLARAASKFMELGYTAEGAFKSVREEQEILIQLTRDLLRKEVSVQEFRNQIQRLTSVRWYCASLERYWEAYRCFFREVCPNTFPTFDPSSSDPLSVSAHTLERVFGIKCIDLGTQHDVTKKGKKEKRLEDTDEQALERLEQEYDSKFKLVPELSDYDGNEEEFLPVSDEMEKKLEKERREHHQILDRVDSIYKKAIN